MQHRILPDEEEIRLLESLRQKFLEKYPVRQIEPVSDQEKEKLKTALMTNIYAYSMGEFLYYINIDTATLLAGSAHEILKKWGDRCQDFYEKDPLNQYMQTHTGLVTLMPQGIWIRPGWCIGSGIWYMKLNKWIPTPGLAFNRTHLDDVLQIGSFKDHLRVKKPVMLSDYPVKLIAPMHVAALIGDKEVIEYLMGLTATLDDQNNYWRVMPVLFPVLFENLDLIDFMLEKGLPKNKALKCAVEKDSFSLIQKLVDERYIPITDDVLESASKRDGELRVWLDIRRRMDVQKQLEENDTYDALKNILNYPVIPIQSLMDLIRIDPAIVQKVENEEDGNTLLHQLVLAKETVKVSSLLEAIYQAGYSNIDGFVFDKNRKNRRDQTILDLVLPLDDELAAAILLYNPKITEAQQPLFVPTKINLSGIRQEREERIHTIMAKQGQTMELQQETIVKLAKELIETKKAVKMLSEQNSLLNHQQQTILMMIMQLYKNSGMSPETPEQQKSLLIASQMANANLMFSPEPAYAGSENILVADGRRMANSNVPRESVNRTYTGNRFK